MNHVIIRWEGEKEKEKEKREREGQSGVYLCLGLDEVRFINPCTIETDRPEVHICQGFLHYDTPKPTDRPIWKAMSNQS